MAALLGHARGRLFARRAVGTHVGYLGHPATDMCVGDVHVEPQSGAFQGGRQRHEETALEVTVEPLDLALGLGPIRPTQPGHESAALGQRQQVAMPAMQPLAVGVTLDNHRLGVVQQDLLGNAAEVLERLPKATHEGLRILVVGEAHVARPAEAERRHERQQRIAAAPDHREVCLHLLAGRRLEAHDRIVGHALERRDVRLELADASGVASFADFPQQHRRRDPVRPGCLDPPVQILVKLIELAGPRRPRAVARRLLATQIPPHRVA